MPFLGVFITNIFFVYGMNKVVMYDSLEVVSYYENKSYCVYDVKIEVFSVQRFQVG